MESSLYEQKRGKRFDLIVGLIVTLFLSSLLFVEFGNINKIMFLVLFIGGSSGLVIISTASIQKVSEHGFLWSHYLLLSIQLVIIYFSEVDYIFELFAINGAILLVKNIIGIIYQKDKREYFFKDD